MNTKITIHYVDMEFDAPVQRKRTILHSCSIIDIKAADIIKDLSSGPSDLAISSIEVEAYYPKNKKEIEPTKSRYFEF